AEPLLQRLADDAADDVAAAARPERHDQVDRLVGILLRRRRRRDGEQERGGAGRGSSGHVRSSPGLSSTLRRYSALVSRLASRTSTHLPAVLRRMVSVQPARRIGAPPGGVMVTVRWLRRYAQSPSTLISRMSLVPSMRMSFCGCEAARNASLPN